ncbi:hypothetical protein LX87_00514 [Larkinella arboricola]|uniref:Uncharacterized protein n=1 Tax=Larkinella arboricola TaxID=643671 RepID=A0A327X8F0_LARAB|nr:hypothetical protein [Larkinella arboricola]RAK02394.1 hypothetical protein LX87_00514 [Larkinella arboricola]
MMIRRRAWVLIWVVGLALAGCYKYEDRVWRAPTGQNGSGTGTPGSPNNPGSGGPGTSPITGLPNPPARPSYIDNGSIRLSVDLNMGGAITYLAASANGQNLVNNWDAGRQIQASFYSGPTPYAPNGKQPHPEWKDLGWNPVMSGDVYGHRSKVLESRNNGREIYVKTAPMLWPNDNIPAECTIETWITLDQNTVKVRHRLNNNRSDTKQYSAKPQELPAIFLNAPYRFIVSYTGTRPFTNDALTRTTSQTVNEIFGGVPMLSPENWMAMVNTSNWGLAVYKPNHQYFIGGTFGTSSVGGEYDFTTAYITPSTYEILDHNIQYDYEYILVLGTLDEIRKYVYAQPRTRKAPDYRFVSDRQSWWYYGGVDRGWPIKNELDIPLDNGNLLMMGPGEMWQAADMPKVYIRAAFKTDATHARLRWTEPNDPEFLPERIFDFPITGDGQYRTYELDMTKVPAWRGTIVKLGFEPALGEKGGPGKWAKIQYISSKP